MEIIGFDGTPVPGSCGQRLAIRRNDGRITTRDGRELTQERFSDLVREGYLTAVEPPIHTGAFAGVCVYVSKGPGTPYVASNGLVPWQDQGEFQVCYASDEDARHLRESYAQTFLERAEYAFMADLPDEARQYARRALSAVPDLAASELAGKTYGLLLAVDMQQMLKEMRFMLTPRVVLEGIQYAMKWMNG
jgi:hypothetical protein